MSNDDKYRLVISLWSQRVSGPPSLAVRLAGRESAETVNSTRPSPCLLDDGVGERGAAQRVDLVDGQGLDVHAPIMLQRRALRGSVSRLFRT